MLACAARLSNSCLLIGAPTSVPPGPAARACLSKRARQQTISQFIAASPLPFATVRADADGTAVGPRRACVAYLRCSGLLIFAAAAISTTCRCNTAESPRAISIRQVREDTSARAGSVVDAPPPPRQIALSHHHRRPPSLCLGYSDRAFGGRRHRGRGHHHDPRPHPVTQRSAWIRF